MHGTGFSRMRAGALLLAVLLIAGVAGVAATYESVDELPEPIAVIEDGAYDLDRIGGGPTARGGWQDLLEVQVFATEETLIFVVFGNGAMLPPPAGKSTHPMLFVLLDVDGLGGYLRLRDAADWDTADRRGYDYLIGYYGGDNGLRRLTGSRFGSSLPIDFWYSEDAAYFEVTWDLIGGRPDHPISFLVYTEDLASAIGGVLTRDMAPEGTPGSIGLGGP